MRGANILDLVSLSQERQLEGLPGQARLPPKCEKRSRAAAHYDASEGSARLSPKLPSVLLSSTKVPPKVSSN